MPTRSREPGDEESLTLVALVQRCVFSNGVRGMGLVATLLPHQSGLLRMRTALEHRYTVTVCQDWADLLRTCSARPVTLAAVDLFAGGDAGASFEWLRQLKRRFPSVGIILYTAAPPARPHDLFEAGRFGLDGLLLADVDDDPRRIRDVVEQALARGVLGALRPALSSAKPTVRDATLLAVSRAHQRLSPMTLAAVLGVRRKVLADRLAKAGYPTAQRLIAWGRLIVAARMLEDDERSADGVAMALDFPSGSAFRNTCQRYLHATPQEIRARGGSEYAIRLFLEEVASARKPSGEPVIGEAGALIRIA